MIKKMINKPLIRGLIDSLPENNKFVQFARIVAKATLFRRRIIRKTMVLFEGVEDAVLTRLTTVGNDRGEILVETLFSAVSPGTERAIYLDEPNFHQERPYVPGYSGCGRVKAVGGKIAGFRKGDLVAGNLKHSSLNIVTPAAIEPLPAGVEPVEASFVTLGVIALAGVRAAEIKSGQQVIVMGQGILGQIVNQLAKEEGAGEVIAVACTDSKKELSLQSGADSFIALDDYAGGREETELLPYTGPVGAELRLGPHAREDTEVLPYRGSRPGGIQADVVIDVTGSPPALETALRMIKPRGTVVLLGSSPGYGEPGEWAKLLFDKKAVIQGAHIRNLEAEGRSYKDEAKEFLHFLRDNKIRLNHLITDKYRPAEAPEIYRRLAAGDKSMVGVVIDWRGM